MSSVDGQLPCVAYCGKEPYAFLSYAHTNARVVYPEIRRLDLMGYRVWYDEGIDPGNEWPDEVANALNGCSQFVVFVTPEAVASRNVRNEINYALQAGKPFLAIHLVETSLPPGMALQMSSIQAILRWRSTEQGYIRQINKVLPRTLAPDVANEATGISAVLARIEYEAMRKKNRNLSDKNLSDKNWNDLDDDAKQNWIGGSERILTNLFLAGYNVVEARDTDVQSGLESDLVDVLARLEHDAWARAKIENGWRYGERRDHQKRLHHCLVPYGQLGEAEKNIDRETALRLPSLLLQTGATIVSIYEAPERKPLYTVANHGVHGRLASSPP